MSHRHGVGPERRREKCALVSRDSRPGHLQGSGVAFERPLSAPSHPPLHALRWAYRVLSRRLRGV
jgi:hypothetical protein